ncbi:hypothetical protein KP729_000143|nr:hypothetical protein [Delftia acidovorans]
MLPVTARRCCAVIVTSCSLWLTACASNPQMPPADLPALPPLPSLSTPLPSESYLKTAAQRMGAWQQRLQGTQLMSRPLAPPGR